MYQCFNSPNKKLNGHLSLKKNTNKLILTIMLINNALCRMFFCVHTSNWRQINWKEMYGCVLPSQLEIKAQFNLYRGSTIWIYRAIGNNYKFRFQQSNSISQSAFFLQTQLGNGAGPLERNWDRTIWLTLKIHEARAAAPLENSW